jgi:hypothetical protein
MAPGGETADMSVYLAISVMAERGLLSWISESTWLSGGAAYNSVTLVISIVGFFATITGLAIAIIQIHRVKKSANAARDAVTRLNTLVQSLSSALDISKIASQWQEAIQYVRNAEYPTASLRCNDVRERLALAREHEISKKLVRANEWQAVIAGIALIHEVVDGWQQSNPSPEYKSTILTDMKTTLDRLNQIAGVARSNAQTSTVKNANS